MLLPGLAMLGAAWVGCHGRVTRAQSGGSLVLMPEPGAAQPAPGRSPDRPRDARAWGISDEQWRAFQSFAHPRGGPISLAIRLNNLRARQFKEDLAELLATVPGWEVEDQGTYTAGSLVMFDGILIQNRSALDPTPEAQLIKEALDAAGIGPEARFDATQPNKIRIVIGAPPGG